MKIAVFGASGRTGQQLIPKLNEHEVIQYTGDILDSVAVEKFLKDSEVVVSVIGHGKNSPSKLQTNGIKNVIKAMKKHKITRIVSLTGTGVRFPGDNITFVDRILNASINIIDSARIKDGIQHVEELKKSGLDWTVIRVLKLTNGRCGDNWRLLEGGPTKISISRCNVAKVIVKVIEQDSFINKSPIIGAP